MPWIPFTPDDVLSHLAERELDVYQETASKETPEDGGEAEVPPDAPQRIDALVAQVLAKFRGAIRANPRVTYMGPVGTLPDFCIESAAVFVRVDLIAMNPVPEGMTDPRMKQYDDARQFLRDLRTMDPKAFAEDEPPATSSAQPSFGGNCRIF